VERLDVIETRLAGMQDELRRLHAAVQRLDPPHESVWPRRATLYLRGSKEALYTAGTMAKLSEEARATLMATCDCEVGVDIEIYEDGSSRPLGIKWMK
jgi:hypothetical protein